MFAAVALLVLALAASPAGAVDAAGEWSYTEVSGIPRFTTATGQGDRFSIWCRHDGERIQPVLEIRLRNNLPAAGELVRVVVDRSMIKLHADAHGLLRTDCRLCADQITWLWQKLRGGTFMQVLFDDGRYAGFGLRQADLVLGARVCLPGDEIMHRN